MKILFIDDATLKEIAENARESAKSMRDDTAEQELANAALEKFSLGSYAEALRKDLLEHDCFSANDSVTISISGTLRESREIKVDGGWPSIFSLGGKDSSEEEKNMSLAFTFMLGDE